TPQQTCLPSRSWCYHHDCCIPGDDGVAIARLQTAWDSRRNWRGLFSSVRNYHTAIACAAPETLWPAAAMDDETMGVLLRMAGPQPTLATAGRPRADRGCGFWRQATPLRR